MNKDNDVISTQDPRPIAERREDEPRTRGKVNRRQLLAGLAAGAAGLTAALVPVLERQIRTASGSDGENATGRQRQWVMVIDLRKCEGCITAGAPPACIEACNAAHFVPKEQQWLKLYQMESNVGYHFFMPVPCMNCENAPCVNVCPVGASYHNREGIVLIDHERCIGCRMCMAACPYGARSFNWDQPENPPGTTFSNYSPEYPVPHRVGTVTKCMLCAHHVVDGKLPACAQACPMYALYLGDLTADIATNGVEVVKLSRFLAQNSAFRLKEELGTRPRVWYIPGHGQDYGHHVDDSRNLLEARSWQEQIELAGVDRSYSSRGGHDGAQ